MHDRGVLLRGTFAHFFTNFTDDLAEINIAAFVFIMKVSRASMAIRKTV